MSNSVNKGYSKFVQMALLIIQIVSEYHKAVWAQLEMESKSAMFLAMRTSRQVACLLWSTSPAHGGQCSYFTLHYQ